MNTQNQPNKKKALSGMLRCGLISFVVCAAASSCVYLVRECGWLLPVLLVAVLLCIIVKICKL